MSPLGTVTTPHRCRQSDNLAASLQSAASEGVGDDERKERRRGDEHVRSGHEARAELAAPLVEEPLEFRELGRRQGRETGQGSSPVAVERRRDTPHAPATVAQLALLLRAVFVQAVWRIGDHGVDASWRLCIQPVKRLAVKQGRTAEAEWLAGRGWGRLGAVERQVRLPGHPVDATILPDEEPRSIERQVGLNRGSRHRAGKCAHALADFDDAERLGSLAKHLEDGVSDLAGAPPVL